MKNRSLVNRLISVACFFAVALAITLQLSGCTCTGTEQNEQTPQPDTVHQPDPATQQTTRQKSQPESSWTTKQTTKQTPQPAAGQTSQPEVENAVPSEGESLSRDQNAYQGPVQHEVPGLADTYADPANSYPDPVEETHYYSIPADTEPTVHQHSWSPVYSYVHHDAVTEAVWVIDSPAWTEPAVYESHDVCTACGAYLDQMSYEEMTAHIRKEILAGGSGQSEIRNILIKEEIYHPERGHNETHVICEAWDEQVVDHYVCTGCGSIS